MDVDITIVFVTGILTLLLGLFLGFSLGKKQTPKIKFDGVLELFERDDSLLVGVSIDTTPEELETQETASFKVIKSKT